jgi:hypothetical protein
MHAGPHVRGVGGHVMDWTRPKLPCDGCLAMHRGKAPSQIGGRGRETEEGCCTTSVKGLIISIYSYERYIFPLTVFPGTVHTYLLVLP